MSKGWRTWFDSQGDMRDDMQAAMANGIEMKAFEYQSRVRVSVLAATSIRTVVADSALTGSTIVSIPSVSLAESPVGKRLASASSTVTRSSVGTLW